MLADEGATGDGRSKTCSEQAPADDLLSKLPDSLLLHILSFLTMEDAVSTALLSRMWRQLWTSTPSLDFSCGSSSSLRARRRYASPDFIDRAVALHEGTKIRTFRVGFQVPGSGRKYGNEEMIGMVDSWVCFAVGCGVEDMELDCSAIGDGDYILSDCVLTCETLVSLSLDFCGITLPPRILMSSLRSLTLYGVLIHDGELKDLLAGCPSLECLVLKNYEPSFYHGMCAERLKTLTICDDFYPWYYPSDEKVHIFTPSLTTFVLTGHLRTYHAMEGLSSIVTASLDFLCMCFWATDFDDYECLVDLLLGLRHVQVLSLCSWCIQVLSLRASESSKLSSEFNIVNLELDVSFITCEFPGIFNALRSFKKLKFLTIDMLWCSLRIKNLKTVSIFGFAKAICAEADKDKTVDEILELEKCRNGFEFVQFLLENAPVLERLTFNATANVNQLTEKNLEILSRFSSRVLALPRASPHALVIMQDL